MLPPVVIPGELPNHGPRIPPGGGRREHNTFFRVSMRNKVQDARSIPANWNINSEAGMRNDPLAKRYKIEKPRAASQNDF